MKKGIAYSKPICLLFSLALLLPLVLVSVPMGGIVEADVLALSEDFEAAWVPDSDGNLAPYNWEVTVTNTGVSSGGLELYWTRYDREYGFELPHSGDYCAGLWWADDAQDEWLMSPELDFSSASEITLSFWSIYNLPSYAGDSFHNYIKVSTDNGASWSIVADLCQDPEYELGGSTGYSNFNWNEVPINIDLPAYSGESSVRVAWQYLYTGGESNHGIWMVDDVELSVTVAAPAEFSATPTTGLTPLEVQFADDSVCDFTSWSWDFGDGGTSNEHNPMHIYTRPGPFTVSLTASGGSCQNATATRIDYIHPYTQGVGGETYPVNKMAILAPWIALGIAVVAGSSIALRHRKAQS